MHEGLSSLLSLFAANAEELRRTCRWQQTALRRLAALLYAAENRAADGAEVRAAYQFLKQNVSVFSALRGNAGFALAAMLSLAPDREAQLAQTLGVYRLLKEAGFWASDYLVLAAYQIAARAAPGAQAEAAARTRAFYLGMKQEHRLLTGQDDVIFAAMLGLSDIAVEEGVARMERLYEALRPCFRWKNALQALTQVLALGGDAQDAAARVLALRDACRQRRVRLDGQSPLSSLGVLALLPGDAAATADAVAEAYRDLRGRRGFGPWSVTKEEVRLFAAALVALHAVRDRAKDWVTAAVSTSVTNIILAQQAAAAAAASSGAAAASSGS